MFPTMEEVKAWWTGASDDAQVFLDAQFRSVVRAIESMEESLDALDTREEWFSKPAAGVADAAGVIDLEITGPRAGFLWILTGISVVVANGAGSSAVVHAGRPGATTPVLTVDDADFYVGAADVGQIPIFPNTNVVTVAVRGAPAGERVTAVLRGKQVPANE